MKVNFSNRLSKKRNNIILWLQCIFYLTVPAMMFFGVYMVQADTPKESASSLYYNHPSAYVSTVAPLLTDRGRVQIVNNTLVADNGYPLRGEAIFLTDTAGSTTGNFTLTTLYDLDHWKTLRDDFHLNAVRFFISRPPQNFSGGPGEDCDPPDYRCYDLDYILNPPDTALDIIDDVVDIASQMGMYIIIDYHPVGGYNETDAMAWWSQIAPRYKDRTHVIYELANEPVAWSPNDYDTNAVNFEENLYQLIRTAAPDTHIILWTFAHGAAGMLNKVNEGTAINYANASVGFHPYGAYSEAAISELKAQYPVINTEIGGNDRINRTQSAENLGISWIWLNGSNIPGLRQDPGNAFDPEDVYWPADPGTTANGDFTLNVTPSTQSIQPGGVATYDIQVQPVGVFSSTVTLMANSPSPSLTLNLLPTAVDPPGQATMTVTSTHPFSSTSSFWYSIPITATANSATQTTSATLLIGGVQIYLPVILKD